MNPMGGPAAAPPLWQEARNADGRVYYYNVQTKATQWNKPVELMTPVERALSNQPWKEYTAEGGRKYWYNTETKQSTWEMPDVYKNALAQVQPSQPPPVAPSVCHLLIDFATRRAPTFVAGGVSSFPSHPQRDRDEYDRGFNDRRGGYGSMDTNGIVAAPVLGNAEPEYGSLEEAENAFMKMLKRHNVQADWSWEQTMRVTIKDPQYRALRDPRDRKAAFEKYAAELRMQEKDRAKERFAKLRADFNTMLKSHPEIKHYSRWKTIRPIIEGETIFRSTNDENERRQLFEEYILELKKEHVEREASQRKAALDELVNILNSLSLEPYTRWSEAQAIIQSNDKIQSDDKFKSLSKSDILTAFENHIKSLERAFNDARQQQKAAKARKERRAREQYIELLKEMKAQGKIKAGSKWMDIYPLIHEDPRYLGMLGNAGSTPLDLLWDMVEEEERSLREPRNDVLDVLEDKRYEITAKTTFEEFNSIVSADRRTANINSDILHLLFDRIKEKAIRRSEEEKHAADRHQRRAMDALRSRLKRLEPPVRATDTWDQVRPRVERLEEYKAIESDELRQVAFDKFIRRLKEKEEDVDRERDPRDRDRGSRRDHHDRADRDHRRGERRGPPSRLSRTPEPDAYEADRRKAQADRERSYRKVSGLSPVREKRDERDNRDRDRERERDRDRYRDRVDRDWDRERTPRPLAHYDRERRDREEERERLYRTRGDPRGGRDELDYGGDTRSTTSNDRRRRRDSDTESVASRSAKRHRRESRERERSRGAKRERREPSTIPEEPKAEDKAVHSGSEEGEIEED
ncbi:snoRNA-splicing protein PRP40 [Aspergillus clavatus NRRL 1]|uniref:Formin binding protein (FNB3), putative n=1 Tax=Aspergillus clavatus (strain ATCC 1007 / CBS 513.65 / DSM 816 / NCTC 3887 / NRRL 1 / QM 1276 / 107) TaxID=344612 RepID=A1CQ85_ASPCL|nr:formin binding protein (FNB3), putative [Aspergillus clavatus NRRL 1]EAW07806.1 formin binding protein (FNB3), putative [Aspergillus clavatus NRRL 1]